MILKSLWVIPTTVIPLLTYRQTGIGVSCMFARIGGVLAPIINMLHDHSLTTPLVIFGISPLLGAVLSLALPETADRPLPDTVEDAENWDMRYYNVTFFTLVTVHLMCPCCSASMTLNRISSRCHVVHM